MGGRLGKKNHGRTERRRLARVDLDEDISSFPGERQLVRISREWKEGNSDELKSETRYFITSLGAEERSAAQLAQAIRGQVLALLRGAILRLQDAEIFESLNASFHHHSAKPYAALRLIKTLPPKIN